MISPTDTQPSHIAASDEALLRAHGYGDILDSPFLARLGRVSFLAVLDHVYGLRTPSTRLEHTLHVASLSFRLAGGVGLTDTETELLVIANLIHDIGHAPFSHNSEPFLIETSNLYHEGMLFDHLRRSSVWFEGVGPTRVLQDRSPDVQRAVLDLVCQRSAYPRLEALLHCPINCDKLDGNNRTLQALGLRRVSEERILNGITEVRGHLFFRRDSLWDLVELWKAEADAYWRHIYTSEVFAGEAMLTRALECVFDTPELIRQFVVSDDIAVAERLRAHSLAGALLRDLSERRLATPVSVAHPELWKDYEPTLRLARFDRAERSRIEAAVARQLRRDAGTVISHFSRRKYFVGQPAALFQYTLFTPDEDLVPIEEVRKALATDKRPGDYCEMFIAGS